MLEQSIDTIPSPDKITMPKPISLVELCKISPQEINNDALASISPSFGIPYSPLDIEYVQKEPSIFLESNSVLANSVLANKDFMNCSLYDALAVLTLFMWNATGAYGLPVPEKELELEIDKIINISNPPNTKCSLFNQGFILSFRAFCKMFSRTDLTDKYVLINASAGYATDIFPNAKYNTVGPEHLLLICKNENEYKFTVIDPYHTSIFPYEKDLPIKIIQAKLDKTPSRLANGLYNISYLIVKTVHFNSLVDLNREVLRLNFIYEAIASHLEYFNPTMIRSMPVDPLKIKIQKIDEYVLRNNINLHDLDSIIYTTEAKKEMSITALKNEIDELERLKKSFTQLQERLPLLLINFAN